MASLPAAGVTGLRAKGAQPQKITCLNIDPVLIQQIIALAFEDEQPVFHHMRFGKGNAARPAGR